jgi:hypothetical protein
MMQAMNTPCLDTTAAARPMAEAGIANPRSA